MSLELKTSEEENPSGAPKPSSIISITSTDISTVSPSCTLIGECIGVESCVDLVSNIEDFFTPSTSSLSYEKVRSKRRRDLCRKKDQFPPPLPSLAMRVLKRDYTSDGRLVLRKEKMKHCQYLRSHRSNGRLTLRVTRSVYNNNEEEEQEEEEQEGVLVDESKGIDNDSVGDKRELDNHHSDNGIELISTESHVVVNGGGGGIETNKGGSKCLNYNRVRTISSNCAFRVPAAVPAIRPVHS